MKTIKGALIGLGIALAVALILMITTDGNIFMDRTFGIFSTGVILVIMGAIIGGFIAYTNSHPVPKKR